MTVRTSLALTLALISCGGDDSSLADGSIQVSVYGEDYIEDEIPANDVADGWAIDFSRFLVVVSDVKVGNHDDDDAFASPGQKVFDLTKPSNGHGHVLGTSDAPGGLYDHGSYTIGPATTGAEAVNVTTDDVTMMVTGGFSVFIQGTATKGGDAVDFAWGFTSNTTYAHCATSAKVDGGVAPMQITVHADHIFFDSAVSQTPDLRFQLIADADGNDDGEVTLAELAAVDITALENYRNDDTSITTLAAFLAAQVQTVGHVDGDGECEAGH